MATAGRASSLLKSATMSGEGNPGAAAQRFRGAKEPTPAFPLQSRDPGYPGSGSRTRIRSLFVPFGFMNQIDTQGEATVRSQGLAPLESALERVIVPAKRRLSLRDVAREGAVIRVLAGRDFKVKYKQSLLGPLWLIFQPLALLAGFPVGFQGLADVKSSGVPYAVFALVGL